MAIIYLLDTFKTPNPIFLDPSRSNLLVYVPQKMATIKHKHPLQISYNTNTKDYNLTDALCSGGENGHPLLENSMDRGAWQAAVHGVAKSQT